MFESVERAINATSVSRLLLSLVFSRKADGERERDSQRRKERTEREKGVRARQLSRLVVSFLHVAGCDDSHLLFTYLYTCVCV